MKGMCEVIRHPRGEVTGRVLKVRTLPDGRTVTFQQRICPVCGRVQGTARTVTGTATS